MPGAPPQHGPCMQIQPAGHWPVQLAHGGPAQICVRSTHLQHAQFGPAMGKTQAHV
jgi:hypothetical protein